MRIEEMATRRRSETVIEEAKTPTVTAAIFPDVRYERSRASSRRAFGVKLRQKIPHAPAIKRGAAAVLRSPDARANPVNSTAGTPVRKSIVVSEESSFTVPNA